MRVPEPLLEGRLLTRYKRFLMDLALPGGEVVTVHCANSGSMEGCLEDGAPVLASPKTSGSGRLGHVAEWVGLKDGWVGINTHRTNQIVGEALRESRLDAFCGYGEVRPEAAYGKEHSRIDFLLRHPGLPDCYLEVKNATWPGPDGSIAFPDAVTARGLKHLRELAHMARGGARAAVLFVANRPRGDFFRACHEKDPQYAAALKRARRQGVELYCHRVRTQPPETVLGEPVPIRIE